MPKSSCCGQTGRKLWLLDTFQTMNAVYVSRGKGSHSIKPPASETVAKKLVTPPHPGKVWASPWEQPTPRSRHSHGEAVRETGCSRELWNQTRMSPGYSHEQRLRPFMLSFCIKVKKTNWA